MEENQNQFFNRLKKFIIEKRLEHLIEQATVKAKWDIFIKDISHKDPIEKKIRKQTAKNMYKEEVINQKNIENSFIDF